MLKSEIMRVSMPKCPVCSSNGLPTGVVGTDRWFGSPGRWPLSKCASLACDAKWLPERPSDDEIPALYESYHTHAYDPKPESSNRFLSHRFSARAIRRRDSCLIPSELTPGKVLEIGCGNGSNLRKFQNAGWEVVGHEIDREAAVQAEKAIGGPVHVGKLVDCDFGPQRFDLVLTAHVLEHLADPCEMVAAAFALLRPGGLFLNFTPNGGSLMFAVLKSRWRGLEPPRHMVLLGPKSGRHLLQTAGFEQVQVASHGAGGGYVVADSLVVGESRALRALAALAGQLLEKCAGIGTARHWELQLTGKKPYAP